MRISYEWEAPKKYKEKDKIAIINIYPTMKCNYNCEYCFTKEKLNNNYSKENIVINKLSELDIWIKKLINYGLKKIKFHILGGEPSLAPFKFYIEFYKILKKYNKNIIFEIYFFSNLNKIEKIKKIYTLFKNIKYIRFDILYSYHQSQIIFNKYIKNIKKILEFFPSKNMNLLIFNMHYSKRKIRKIFKDLKHTDILIMINSINYKISEKYYNKIFGKFHIRKCYAFVFSFNHEGILFECPKWDTNINILKSKPEDFIINCDVTCFPCFEYEFEIYKEKINEFKFPEKFYKY